MYAKLAVANRCQSSMSHDRLTERTSSNGGCFSLLFPFFSAESSGTPEVQDATWLVDGLTRILGVQLFKLTNT